MAPVPQHRRRGTHLVARGDIWHVGLGPTVGSEIRKPRPCLVVSPPEINEFGPRVIVAPMTTGSRPAPFRVPIRFAGKDGLVLLDQIRTVDIARLERRLGAAAKPTLLDALRVLREMFSV